MRKLAFIIITLLIITSASAQAKVAQYSLGEPGADNYEHLEFWIKNDKRTDIRYAYGKDRKEVKLMYISMDKMDGDSCFTVQFPNHYILYIIPAKLQLKVKDSIGKYDKVFSWEYEGPVNGTGTFCDVCAEDDEEAIDIVRSYYLK